MNSENRLMRSIRFPVMGTFLSFVLIAMVTPTLLVAQESLEQLQQREDEILERMDELGLVDDPTDEQLAEMQRLDKEYMLLVRKIETAEKNKTKTKATPKPRATPRARPTPKPRSTVPRVDEKKGRAKPSPTPKPRRSTPAKRDRSKPRTGRGNKPKGKPAPSSREIELSAELNELAENLLKDFSDRKYEFAIENGTYAELIEALARMSGLEVIGKAPEGSVSFTSKGGMNFKAALARIQVLLFEHPQQYWLYLNELKGQPILQISRLTEGTRELPIRLVFPTVDAYRAQNLDENELALLQFTPESGSIAEIEFLRDFMPDYVRISQKEGENALLIFGLVRDINKYLALVEKFEETIEDPRQIEIIPIQHITPSSAIELLKQLMDGFGNVTGAPAKVRRAGQVSVAEAWAEKVTAITFDEQGTLLVKAMPNKIKEIKRLLPYVDISPEVGEPVIVSVEHGNASDIITIVRSVITADATAAPKPRSSRSRTKSTVPAGARASAANDLTLIDWEATNSIILLGPKEQVDEAKALIKRFDVPDGKDIVQVTVQHNAADQLAQRVTQIAQVMRPGSAARLSCTASPDGEVIVLAGPVAEIDAAKIIISKLDVESTDPPELVHVYQLEHVLPSQLVNILSAWDSTEGPAKAAKGSSRRSRRAAGNTAKFHADDQRGVLYVVCSEEEWIDRYEPVLAQLDQELEAPEFELIRIEYIEPSDAITQITSLFAAAGKPGRGGIPGGPKCVAVPEGVMVLDATAAQMESIKQLVGQIDVDLIASGKRIKRTFELAHSDPLDVIERLQVLIGAPKPGPKGAAAQGGDGVLFIDHQDSVIVWAPARRMDEIADLVAQLDTPLDENVLRSYSFGPGVDVVELSDILTRFFEQSATVKPPQVTKPGKAARGARAATASRSAGRADLLFLPQPDTRRIVVSAPPDMFEEIEETIEMLRPDGPNTDVAVDVQFFDVVNGDADAIAGMVEPIIQVKLNQMIASSEMTMPSDGKPPSVKVSADAASKRIVAAAPAILMPDVAKLIERFDSGDYGKRVTRRVQLAKANAEDVVEVIKVMLSGGKGSAPVSRIKRKGVPAQPKAPVSAKGETISVVAALSGDAVILIGFENELDEVEGWVRELDESTPDEFEIKVFRGLDVDVETLADEIITILDKPAAGGKAPPKAEEDDLFGFDDIWDFGGPRCGTEICLTTNPFSNVLVVRTTPEKMRAVEQWVALYVAEPGKPPLTAATEDLRPNEILELRYADAYDAVYDLENIIDVIWKRDKPDVEKVPFENMLVVRAKTQEDIEKVKGYIAKYIDNEPIGGPSRIYRTTAVKGQPADLVLKMLMMRLEGKDVEIEGLDGESGKSLVKILGPNRCVLPSVVAIRAAELTATAAILQAKVDEQADAEKDDPDDKTVSPDKALLDLLDKVQPEPDTSADETTEQSPPEKPKIKVDWRTNSIIVSGGSPSEVEEIEDTIEDILRELEDAERPPDIRVYQLEYLDPNIASQVLGAMFNVANQGRAAGGRMTPQQLAAQQKQMQQQMQQRIKQMQEQAKKGGGEKEGDKGKESGGDDKPKSGSSKQQSIRVFPYPALRALIVNAPTEMFPAIEELVATIDRKREVPPEYRFFPLEKQRASDVEQMLKIMLGLDEKTQRTARGGKNADPAVQAVAEMMKAQLNLPVTGPEGEIVSSSDSITITSNDNTNTVMAVAPISVLDLVGEIITELESQEIPPIETRKFVLKFADATVVSPMLEQLFAVQGGSRGGSRPKDGSVFNPSEVSQYVSFHADESNNAIFVRGIASDFEKIEPVIAEVDIKTAGDDVIQFTLIHADAQDVAQSLGQVYENRSRGPRGGGASNRIQFVGDRSSNTLFARLPEELREEVTQKVQLMDRLASSKPRLVELQFGNPKSIADTLERVYGGGRGGSSRVKISGDDATKQLLVVCPDEMFEEIQQTAKMMDVKEDLDIQVFMLKHAKAKDVLQGMKQLVADAMRMMSRTGGGSQMGPFSATADERTNSIAVMGGPLAFAMVSKVLADIDIPSGEAGGKSVHVVNLNYATAETVVWSLRELLVWGKPNGGDIDVSSPRGTNAVVVNATQQDFEKIKKIIDQLDVLPGDEGRTARLIMLKHTEAADMQAIIEDYLSKPGGSGRGRGGGQDLMGGIKISAMESTNTLVVTGDDAGIDRVATLVEKIDVEVEAGTAPKIIKLVNAVASEIEPTITAMFEQVGRGRTNRRGGGRSTGGGMTPVVVADDGANALIVRATPADYQIIEDLARDLDEQQGEAGTPFKLIQLASAFRAEDLAPTVEAAMRQASGSGSRSPRGGRRNSAGGGGSELSVEAITASNSLLLTGDPKDLELAEAVVATIQKNGPAGGKRTLIFRPDNISPDELKRVIDSMSDQGGRLQGRRNQNRRPRRR